MAQLLMHRLSSTLETHRGRDHLDALDGLRGVAVLLVLLCHFQVVVLARMADHFQHQPFYLLASFGGSGVDLFFLLSGYLVYPSFLRPHSQTLPFLTRRLQRIYPAYLAVLAIYLLLPLMVHQGGHYHPDGPGAWLQYVSANLFLLPGVLDLPSVLYPAWSLSFELVFYFSLPLLVLGLGLRRWRSRARLRFWLTLLVLGLVAGSSFPALTLPRHFQQSTMLAFLFFPAGMALAEGFPLESSPLALHSWQTATLLTVLLLSLGCYAAVAWPILPFLRWNATSSALLQTASLLCVYSTLLVFALSRREALSGLLRTRTLRWTGNISYSLYLSHGLVLDLVALLLRRFPSFTAHAFATAALLLSLALVGTFALAMLLFLTIERPFSLLPLRERPKSSS